jgi:hypothetical protein
MLETNKMSAPEIKVEAFNLSGYIEHLKHASTETNKWDEQIAKNVSDLRNIVESVAHEQRDLEKMGAASLKFEFFKESDLLIVIGPPDAVTTAGKIVGALPGEDDQRGLGYLLGPMGQNPLDGGAGIAGYKLLQPLAK